VYGCREGRSAACKWFLLEGEASLKGYSTFALSDAEEASGYTPLWRAMPDTDLTVEFLSHPGELQTRSRDQGRRQHRRELRAAHR
jgi:hypothetical protein